MKDDFNPIQVDVVSRIFWFNNSNWFMISDIYVWVLKNSSAAHHKETLIPVPKGMMGEMTNFPSAVTFDYFRILTALTFLLTLTPQQWVNKPTATRVWPFSWAFSFKSHFLWHKQTQGHTCLQMCAYTHTHTHTKARLCFWAAFTAEDINKWTLRSTHQKRWHPGNVSMGVSHAERGASQAGHRGHGSFFK